jgi:uncharacterized protein
LQKDLIDHILNTLPDSWTVHQVYIGPNWTISVVRARSDRLRAGLAASPSAGHVSVHPRFEAGLNRSPALDATALARCAQAGNPVEAAVGFATLNALLRPAPAQLTELDAVDWLVEQGRDRSVALVGRFPFIGELAPVVARLWVLELNPQPGEYHADQAPQIIPRADVVALTSSTLLNHTFGNLLALARPEAKVMLLGPTTPLTPLLFDLGVDLLSGVQVVDVEATLASVRDGVTFQQMAGVRRVTMRKR